MKKNSFSVGVDFHEWDGIFQGSRNHVLGIYKAAIRLAPDINFFFFLHDIDSLVSEHEEFASPHVKLVKMPPLGGFFRLAWQLPRLCAKYKIDILHTQYRVPFFRWARSVCTIHDILFESHPFFFSKIFRFQSSVTFRLAARYSDRIFTVSHFSKSELVRIYGVPASNIAVTYNGVDPARFYPGQDGSDIVTGLGLVPGSYIVTVGRLEPRKNQVALVKAWQALKRFDLPLVVVGQPDHNFPEIQENIKKAAADFPVIQFRNMGDDMLPAVLRHAKLFVYPAFAEGFGMPVAEAMASGVPVITSNTTSMPEVAGDCAFFCDPYDTDSLESALRCALNLNSDDLDLRIHRGLEQVVNFNWHKSAIILVENLRDLASSIK